MSTMEVEHAPTQPSNDWIANSTSNNWILPSKLYLTMSLQLAVTAVIGYFFEYTKPPSHYIFGTKWGLWTYSSMLGLYVGLILLACRYKEEYPKNLVLLILLSLVLAFNVESLGVFLGGAFVFEATFYAFVAVSVIAFYSEWAKRRAHEFTITGPFLSSSLVVLTIFAIQVYFQMESLFAETFGCVVGIIVSAIILYNTKYLIIEYGENDCIIASMAFQIDKATVILGCLGLDNLAGPKKV